ncbi:mCG146012, partial [Mus musculus]
ERAFLPISAPSSRSPGDKVTRLGWLETSQLLGCCPSSTAGPRTCLLLVPYSVLQGLHLLQLVLVAPQLCSLGLLSLVQKQQLLLSVILLQGGGQWVHESSPSHEGTHGIHESYSSHEGTRGILLKPELAGFPPHCGLSLCSRYFPGLCPEEELSLCPADPSSPESAHFAGAAPCLAASSYPVRSAVASASWTLLGWEEAGSRIGRGGSSACRSPPPGC